MKPVFVVGCPRTGSKIYMNILRSCSEIDVMPEIHFLQPIWLHRDFVRSVKRNVGDLEKDSNIPKLIDLMYSGKLCGSFWRLIDLDRERLQNQIMSSDRLSKSIFEILLKEHAVSRGKTTWGAKFPVHFSYIPKLLEWFPECRIIHLIRDPRAIYSSQAYKHLLLKWPNSRLGEVLIRLVMFVYVNIIYRWAIKTHNRFKHFDNYYLSQYENLILDPEGNLKRLCHFLKIDFRQDMLYPPVVDSSYGKSQQKKGFDKDSVNRWKKHISPISAKFITMLNRRGMREMGYL